MFWKAGGIVSLSKTPLPPYNSAFSPGAWPYRQCKCYYVLCCLYKVSNAFNSQTLEIIMNIEQPVVTIIPSPSGMKYTYRVQSKSWRKEYQRTKTWTDKGECQVAVKKFEKAFHAQSKDIESGAIPQMHIMRMLSDHLLFRSRDMMTERFNDI